MMPDEATDGAGGGAAAPAAASAGDSGAAAPSGAAIGAAPSGGGGLAVAPAATAPSMSSLPPLAAARAGAAVAIGPDTTGEGRIERDRFDQEAPAANSLGAARSGVPFPLYPDVEDAATAASSSLPDPDSLPRSPVTMERRRTRKKQAFCGALVLMVVCAAVLVTMTYFGPRDELTEGSGSASSSSTGGGWSGRPKPPPSPSPPDEGDSEDTPDDDRDDDASRLKHARQFILDNSLSAPGALGSSTPQRRALEWIAFADPLRIKIPQPYFADYHQEYVVNHFVQRYSLAVVYFALGGTTPGNDPTEGGHALEDGKKGWKTRLNFLEGWNECWWNERYTSSGGKTVDLGVTCDGKDPVTGKPLNQVTKLWIPWDHHLVGTLAPEIRHLTHLTSISMAYQNITGEIPESICLLPNLEEFSLSNNYVTGPIPRCMRNMKALKILAMDDNLLTGHLNVIDDIKQMQFLYLEDNTFDDTLDNDSFNNLKELVHLDISDNGLLGVVPEHLFSHPTLRVLDLHDNELAGPLPATIEEQAGLEFLALHKNNLNGTVTSLGNLTSLVYLDVAHNEFTGVVQGLSKLKKLKYLFLGGNFYFNQDFPPFLEDMTDLLELSLKDSSITDHIPSWIGKLTKLYLLDLDGNFLDGEIPFEMGNLTNLMYLLLNNNNLRGEVPSEMSSLVNLRLALLDDNDLVGSLNETLCAALGNESKAHVTADCGGSDPQIVCKPDCCSLCCADGDPKCNDEDWIANNDPIWEHRYGRYRFDFEDLSD